MWKNKQCSDTVIQIMEIFLDYEKNERTRAKHMLCYNELNAAGFVVPYTQNNLSLVLPLHKHMTSQLEVKQISTRHRNSVTRNLQTNEI